MATERMPLLVLAGGEGRRLGIPKAWLPWSGRPLLLEVLDRLAPLAMRPVVVAARADQELPAGDYVRVDDPALDAGPLAGVAAGLAAFAAGDPRARVAVAACDYPFAEPALFRALASRDPEAELVLPRAGGHLHPLQAIWRASLGEACAAALGRGERRLRPLVEAAGAVVVDADELDGVDAERALLNLNDADALERALRLAGRS